jgi:hypothetical protein
MDRVIERIEHYKNEHYAVLKEFTTLLELALWKAKLYEESLDLKKPSARRSVNLTQQRKPKSI